LLVSVTGSRQPGRDAPKGALTLDRLDDRAFRLAVLGLLTLTLVFAAYVLLALRGADPDMFWHIATGRWIAGHRMVPTTDPFSWWAAPRHQPWVAMEWLFGLCIFGVFTLGGYAAVYWATAALTGLVALLAYALVRARGVGPLWALLLTAVSGAGVLGFVAPRPQMVTFVLILLAALLLERDRPRAALLVVLAGVNVHGGVWPLYVALFAYYELPRRWWLVLAAATVTLANPNPVGVALYPLRLFQSPATTDIMEWVPTALWTRKGDLLAYVAVLVAVQGRRIPWRDALFALALVLLSLSAVRHVAWLYVLVIPVLAPTIACAGASLASLRLPARPARADRPRPAATAIIDVALVTVLAAAALAAGVRAVSTRLDVSREYPQPGILAYLKDAGAARVFNMYGEGGYLIAHGVQPMIDGRFDPYLPAKTGDPDLAQQYMDVVYLRSDPRSFMARWGVDYALVSNSRLRTALRRDPAFIEVKSDATHTVFKFDASR